MSATNPWPDFNPFPFQATSTTPNTSADLADPPSGSVTFLFPHVIRAGDLVHDYLRTYDGMAGRAAMLNGEHGSGKSHTIRHLIERIVHGNWQSPEVPPAVKLAVKIVNADFMAVYQQLVAQIDLDLLRSVAADSKKALVERRWVENASTDKAKGLIEDRLRTDKGAAMEALWRSLVDSDAVETDQAREIVRAGIGYEDFQRVVPFILSKNKDLAVAAHAWLANKPLPSDDLKKLGVSGPIASLDVCVSALQLITILFRRAGRPLLMFLDQCEKLTKEGEATPQQVSDNIAVLRQLVEVFPDNGAFLMIAGTEEAWNKFSPDLQARFRAGLVNVSRLNLDQTRDVLAAYIAAAQSEPAESRIFPFDEGAVQALHRFSRGTLRAVLQAAWALYNEAVKQSPRAVIDSDTVDRALASELIKPPASVDEVRAAVQKLLQESGLLWRPDFPIDEFVAQYAVVDSDELPTLVVHVVSAAFHDDEILNAQRLVSTIRDWQRTRGATPLVVMILTGYVSKRVLDVLGSLESVVRTVVYDPAGFRAEFSALLAAARRVPRPVAKNTADDEKLKTELDRVRGELQKVREQSEGNVDRLERRLKQVLSTVRPASTEPLNIIYERWRDERRGLEKEIETKRAERARNELDQLRRGAKRAEQLRTRRLATLSAGQLTVIGLLAAFLRLRLIWANDPTKLDVTLGLNALIIGGVGGAIVVAFFLGYYFRIFESNAMQVAAGPLESLEDLDQLRFREKQALAHLKDSNPQVRYVAWRSLERGIRYIEFDHFTREPLPLVRRAAAEAMTNLEWRDPYFLREFFEINEFAYVVERGKIDLSNATRKMLLVARIAEAHDGASYLQVFYLLAGGHAEEFAEAFVEGRVVGADVIGRQACRAALALLSPLDDGLGTLDDLKCIDTVDELFFFFKRELFFADRGVADAAAG